MKYNAKILSTDNVLLKNVGVIDPLIVDEYVARGGYDSLKKAIGMDRRDIIEAVSDSGLRGRGGANFPTGRKWMFTYSAQADQKYIVINADEGEPGTVKDRVLMEGDPHQLIEGIVIAAYAIGATKGFVYVRGEYRASINTLKKAIAHAKEKGFLGEKILGTDFSFDLLIAEGGGAYICGEETALINSIEGKRGETRLKPPYPPVEGLFGKPTIVNNVETICNIPHIISKGSEWYRGLGPSCSPGTKLFMLSGDVNEPGILETPLDISFGEVIERYGKGVDGGKIKFAQIGGSSGNIFTPEMLDKVWSYERCCEFNVSYGTGSIFVCNDSRNMVDHLLTVAEFFEHESCGKCTPCREGTHRVVEILEKFAFGEGTVSDLELLKELSLVMKRSSLCGLGQACINPVLDAIEYYKGEILAN